MTSGNATQKHVRKRSDKKRTDRTPAKRRTRKYDWEAIKTAFIEGIPVPDGGQYEREFKNQREISEFFDVPYVRVRERASKERWVEQRHKQQVELAARRQKERNEKILGDAIDFDESTLRIAKTGITLIQSRLAEIASDVRLYKDRRDLARKRMELGEKVEPWELWSAINYREMESLASAAARLQEIGNKALGIDVQRHEISGPGGGPLQIDGVSVGEELLRDDPERITAVLATAARSGLLETIMNTIEGEVVGESADDDEVVEGELVDAEDDEVQ